MTTTARAPRAHGRTVCAVDDNGLKFPPAQTVLYAAWQGEGLPLLLCPFEQLAMAMLLDFARHRQWLLPMTGGVTMPGNAIHADILYRVPCPLTGRQILVEGYGLIEDAECALEILGAEPVAVARLAERGYHLHSDGVEYRPADAN